MEEKTYKMLDLVGISDESIEGAIKGALQRASTTVRNIDWFEVKEIRGSVAGGKPTEFQVKFTCGFRLEDTK